MLRKSFTIAFIVGLFSILCGCETDKELYEKLFKTNNASSIERFESIMYSESDLNNNPEERFKMVHISDPHISGYSEDNHYKNPVNFIQAIRFANQPSLRMNTIAVTGDLIGYSKNKKTAESYLTSFSRHFHKNNTIPSILCIGNHDNNYPPEEMNPDGIIINRIELNHLLFSFDTDRSDHEKKENYYYIDVPNPQGGYIRLISLDMIDHSGMEYNALIDAYYSQQQMNWLGNIALKKDITSEHSIIILNHFPLEPTTGDGKTSYLYGSYFVNGWQMIPEIVEAFRSQSSLQKTYPNAIHKEDSITVDFDFTGSDGEFICYLGGHAHCFACFDLKQLSNENPSLPKQKMILCTNQSAREKGVVYNKTPREDKTTTSNNFNLYAIDTREKRVYITFFGANAQFYDASLPDIFSFCYLD